MTERSLPPMRSEFRNTHLSLESRQLSGPLRLSAAGGAEPPSQIRHAGGFAVRDWLWAEGRNDEAHAMEGLML
jgi:hypothetical protein